MIRLPINMQSKIAVVNGCWEWTGCTNSKGYGCVHHDGKVRLTHRVSYELLVGQIPDGLQIDHLCRNKRCCNPKHLEAVTAQENTRRAQGDRCKYGHPLAGPNVKVKSKGSAGFQRQCAVCQIDERTRRTARESKGMRRTSATAAARREARRQWLLQQGEAALMDGAA